MRLVGWQIEFANAAAALGTGEPVADSAEKRVRCCQRDSISHAFTIKRVIEFDVNTGMVRNPNDKTNRCIFLTCPPILPPLFTPRAAFAENSFTGEFAYVDHKAFLDGGLFYVSMPACAAVSAH